MDKVSYAMGIGIGMQLKQMGATDMNVDDFAAAIKDVLAGNELKVPNHEAQQIVQDYFMAQEKKLNEQRAAHILCLVEAAERAPAYYIFVHLLHLISPSFNPSLSTASRFFRVICSIIADSNMLSAASVSICGFSIVMTLLFTPR